MPYGKARLIIDKKLRQGDLLMHVVVWRLPFPTIYRPESIKFRLYLGKAGRTLVRYDNETGKGSHRHVGPEEREEAYGFSSLDALLADFFTDCERHGWRWDDEKTGR